MAEITLDATATGPRTHALVIGVSHYPYLAGDAATQAGLGYGLEDLSSAARSASEMAAWLLNEYRNPGAPLASVRVLLSPADGETLADGVVERLDGPYAATRDAVERDLMAFRATCSERSDDVAFVYVAGHGIQLSNRGAIVLLEDFADPLRADLGGAIDMVTCHEAMNGSAYAANQFWFVDACRQLPAVARQFENFDRGALSFAVRPGKKADASWLFLASASRAVAFAEVGGSTLFSQAVLAGLRGAAAVGPEDERDLGWHVPAGRLAAVAKRIVAELAAARGEEQSVDPVGFPGEAVVSRLEGPPVGAGPAPRVSPQGQGVQVAPGRLQISFKSSSWFLGQNLPVEVRDAGNRLILRSAGPVDVELPEGQYTVEATVPGGSRISEVVAVAAGAPTELVLSRRKPDATVDVEGDEAETRDPAPAGAMPVADLVDVRACELREQRGSTWIFDPVPELDETPMATFAIAGRMVSTSLPVNPSPKVEERSCSVTLVRRSGRVRVDVGFARERRVAWTLEGMVKAGDVVSTAELFRNAEQILLAKYRDPSAAALGGLTLHRIGRLRERTDWVENLARDFRWVVDGRVLLAALLANDENPDQRARGLDTLLEAAPLRPLFTDGQALKVQLLRTWPDGSRLEARRAALAAITSNPATVDRDAMALTMYDEG